MTETLTWLGILFCITQSASLSGLNLAMFSVSRLRLEAAAVAGDPEAGRVMDLRRDANFTLVTILWANVAVNVLLTLLAESVLAGVATFLFSTVVITVIGEIVPQAYFSRHAIRVASLLAPLLRFYQVILWPVARPVASLLDRVIGPEPVPWFRERELRDVLLHHARSTDNEVSRLEALGAINFLALDDLAVVEEGEPIDPESVIALPMDDGRPVFPTFERAPDDPFLRRIASLRRRWIVITDEGGEPHYVMDANAFLRKAIFGGGSFDPSSWYYRPLIVRDAAHRVGSILSRLTVRAERPGDDVVDEELTLVWTEDEKRVISGSDLLGRLLRGIARVVPTEEWHEATASEPAPPRPTAAGTDTGA